MIKAKELLLGALKTDYEKTAYLNSDGRGSLEVAKASGVSHTTVVSYWNRWATLGIVEPLAVKGGTRFKAVFSLPDLGIRVPSPSTSEKPFARGRPKTKRESQTIREEEI